MAQVLEIPETALDVEAVYTIGSAGTVAQTRDSDLDIWVCLTEASAKRPEIPAFTAKLEAITARAARDYDLEIHFFLMGVPPWALPRHSGEKTGLRPYGRGENIEGFRESPKEHL